MKKTLIVNNKNLAKISIKFNLQKHLQMTSAVLQTSFNEIQAKWELEKGNEYMEATSENDINGYNNSNNNVNHDDNHNDKTMNTLSGFKTPVPMAFGNTTDTIDTTTADNTRTVLASTHITNNDNSSNNSQEEENVPVTMNSKLTLDNLYGTNSTTYKCLADILEALVGAIFLDSKYSVDTVREILMKMDILPKA